MSFYPRKIIFYEKKRQSAVRRPLNNIGNHLKSFLFNLETSLFQVSIRKCLKKALINPKYILKNEIGFK
jgi:hypothetical protein